MAAPSRAVLITGCSTGIGRATAIHLAREGWPVYATARRLETIGDLANHGCHVLALDVTDDASARAAVARVEAEHGAVGVLVNNAGYSQSGSLEAVPLDKVRAQFETNVFGLVRLSQLVLPRMRAQRWGRIVNLSSMGGKLVLPGGGYYHATKYAIEALSDALRFEVEGFGIDVIVIEPGLVRTHFAAAAVGSMQAPAGRRDSGGHHGVTPSHPREGTAVTMGARAASDVYGAYDEAVERATRESYEKGPVAPLVTSAEAVAEVIATAVTASRPRTRYTVGASATVFLTLRRVLSDRLWDRFLSRTYPQPGRR